MSGLEDSEALDKRYQKPHSVRNPIPTIQQYREAKQQQRQELGYKEGKQTTIPDTATHGDKLEVQDSGNETSHHHTKNQNGQPREREQQSSSNVDNQQANRSGTQAGDDNGSVARDTSEATAQGTLDAKQKRKQLKRSGVDRVQREVTDPVTHLPVTIYDFTDQDLVEVEEEGQDDDNDGVDNSKNTNVDVGYKQEGRERPSPLTQADRTQTREHDELLLHFPPPRFDQAQHELARVHKRAAVIVVFFVFVALTITLSIELFLPDNVLSLGYRIDPRYLLAVEGLFMLLFVSAITSAVGFWSQKQASAIWEDAVWHSHKAQSRRALSTGQRETTLWLSKLIGSIWPIINPDLFKGLADTLEDVMQASLPRAVRMVSVDDIGQGSEPMRILGVRWLPKGAAAEGLSSGGSSEEKDTQDCTQNGSKNARSDNEKDDNSQQAMDAEEGEFVNLEVAFAYRASRFQKKLKDRAKNAHLFLAFYLPGNIKLPVWVELHGVVGWCRARLQLTPDPPFVALCTLTFLGQPKVDMTCVPLLKSGLNIMDLPLISNFVQSSIDAALSEYVAPKSISLNLQEMLAGSDFKKDTTARGVLAVRIKRAFDFKASDVGMPILGKEKSSDAYVSVGWAKFGKPMWSTRVIEADMKPWWKEETFLLVGAEELDAKEALRIQLWDSDKFSADDDLGRIELDLKDLMRSERSNSRMWDRVDSFKALEANQSMPGRLEWSVGYFSKVRLLDSQFKQKNNDPELKSVDDLRKTVYENSQRKLREAAKNESAELEQLKEDDWMNTQVEMISSSLPPDDFPSGILSIHVHQITGLQVEDVRKTKSREEEEHDDFDDANLPDSYCSIIVNEQKVFKTRTKPKNARPFFNACTERFVRDWRSTSIMISVRDQRVHEDDPLLGCVYVDLGRLFRAEKTSHFHGFYPLAGGIGYGRLRASVVFRSSRIQLPHRSLGWEIGILEVASGLYARHGISKGIGSCQIRLKTNLGGERMRATKVDNGGATWTGKQNHSTLLAVRKRYSSNLVIEFENGTKSLLPKSNKIEAFTVLWLKNIPDEEWVELKLPIYSNRNGALSRVTANVLPNEELNELKIEDLVVSLRFWRGLGKPHRKLAKKDSDVADIMEVKDAAREHGECDAMVGFEGWRESRDTMSKEDEKYDSSRESDDNEAVDGEYPRHRGNESEEPQNDNEEGHVSRVGEMARRVRRKLPFGAAHDEHKQSSNADEESKQKAPASNSVDATTTTFSAPQVNLRTEATNEVAMSPTIEVNEPRDHRNLSEKEARPSKDLTADEISSRPNLMVEDELNAFGTAETQSSAASNAHPQGDDALGETETSDTKAATDEGAGTHSTRLENQPESDDKRSHGQPQIKQATASTAKPQQLSTPQQGTHSPGTSTQSRLDQVNNDDTDRPQTPQRDSNIDTSPSPSSLNRSQSKRASGMFSNIKRSFSLRSSPLSRSDQKSKDKRSSRVFSDSANSQTDNMRANHTSSRPASSIYDRSPLSSHPTASSATSTPPKRQSDASPSRASTSRTQKSDDSHVRDKSDSTNNENQADENRNIASNEQIHRRHRGIMQFKGPRTAKWLQHKGEAAVAKAASTFEHKEREPDVETEV